MATVIYASGDWNLPGRQGWGSRSQVDDVNLGRLNLPPSGAGAFMTTFYLIRNATNDYSGKAIAGRLPGISLNREGEEQAADLASRLAKAPIQFIISSPLERAVETAVPLAKRLGLDIQISEALNEIDYGDWIRLDLEQLAALPRWHEWQSARSVTSIPDGEMMIEVQLRMVREIHRLTKEYPDQTLALFSHADPIRSALAYYLGVPLDLFHRIVLDPASVSILTFTDSGPNIISINR